MRSFNKIFTIVIMIIIIIFFISNMIFLTTKKSDGRPYRVEINRLAYEIENSGFKNIKLENCIYVTNITCCDSTDFVAFFEDTDSDYSIKIINNMLYRFDYTFISKSDNKNTIYTINIIITIMSLIIILIMLFIRNKILKPFEDLQQIPYELSKGNLTIPIKENKYKFFGKFIWGINILRENIEQHKQLELDLLKEKKTLVLSLSHDIKTPLSAIKLYSKALSKGLYTDKEKHLEIAENINTKADEIEKFVSEIIKASSEDFLKFDVKIGEFYLSELEHKILDYYKEKLSIMKIDFCMEKHSDCILKGDLDKSIDVLQNIIENAIKYGDGNKIEILFSEEEDCKLVTVKNSGCTLSDIELLHIFDSFWRGSNSENIHGSGLGLYICRQLMNKMGGEIFAKIQDGNMLVTIVFVMAG